jgi:hypothetical protein
MTFTVISDNHNIIIDYNKWHFNRFLTKIAVMARYGTLSRRPPKEPLPVDMNDDKTVNTDHTHIPLPSLPTSITCPDSDRCDIAVVSVPPLRRSTPSISRFCPVLGWRTMLQLLVCRATESNTFSVPDSNTSWNRTEDDLLVETVAKHSTSDVLFPDWIEFVSELTGCFQAAVQRTLQTCWYCGGTDICISECNFSWLPFLTILSRSHKRYRLGGFYTTSSLQ